MKIANHGDPLTTVLCLSTFVPDEHPLAESFITFFEKAKKEPKLIQVFAETLMDDLHRYFPVEEDEDLDKHPLWVKCIGVIVSCGNVTL